MLPKIYVGGLLLLLLTLTASAQSTTFVTVGTTTISQTQGIALSCFDSSLGPFLCIFNIVPLIGFILIIAAFLIGYVTTTKLTNGLLIGFLISAIITSLLILVNASAIYPQYIVASTILGVGMVLVFMFESHK